MKKLTYREGYRQGYEAQQNVSVAPTPRRLLASHIRTKFQKGYVAGQDKAWADYRANESKRAAAEGECEDCRQPKDFLHAVEIASGDAAKHICDACYISDEGKIYASCGVCRTIHFAAERCPECSRYSH